MVKSVIEQKIPLATCATETGIVTPSPSQLGLTQNVVAALSPTEELTNYKAIQQIVYLFPLSFHL